MLETAPAGEREVVPAARAADHGEPDALGDVVADSHYIDRKGRPKRVRWYRMTPVEDVGFEPFEDSRGRFDVRFYLVSLLFIIFDLEVAFLFPWAVAFKEIGAFGFWAMMVFLAILTIGFIYEWRKGALEWD